jgi:riboflavin kinase/FMN adenylyltransferase
MRVIRSLPEVPREPAGRALALGTFDGVHLGHRRVIGSALERARARGLVAAVVTFDPHPLEVLRPDRPPRLLTTIERKIELVSALGLDELVAIPFTEERSRQSAEEFCDQVLVATLGARSVSVGANFHFGHGAAGDATLLRSRPEFDTEVVELVAQDGESISSSRIRSLVDAGDVAGAARLLGAPYALAGRVVEGDRRGRELGMPTANLDVPEQQLLPAPGIYAATATGERIETELPAAVSIGVRPTFGGGALLVEAHLIGFEGDLYGTVLQLEFLERLRDEERFDSAEALVEQMRKDVADTRAIAARAATVSRP